MLQCSFLMSDWAVCMSCNRQLEATATLMPMECSSLCAHCTCRCCIPSCYLSVLQDDN